MLLILLNEIEAKSYHQKLPLGSTDPFIANTQNQTFVCKLCEDHLGNLHLVNEYVCYHLAKLLGLPLPSASLIRFSDELISSNQDLSNRKIKSNLAFGSELVKKVQTNINPILLESCKNTNIIPNLILFDQLILNNDRATNDGNLLFDLKTKELIVIDHTHVFIDGTIWNEITLEQNKNQLLVDNFQMKYYKMLNRYIYGNNPFNDILKRISQVRKEDIKLIIDSIPQEWAFSPAHSAALTSFLLHRLSLVPNILKEISSECPQWKGAI